MYWEAWEKVYIYPEIYQKQKYLNMKGSFHYDHYGYFWYARNPFPICWRATPCIFSFGWDFVPFKSRLVFDSMQLLARYVRKCGIRCRYPLCRSGILDCRCCDHHCQGMQKESPHLSRKERYHCGNHFERYFAVYQSFTAF